MTSNPVTKATAVGLSGGRVQYNDNDSSKPWYTGALRTIKRGDWVQWMVQYFAAGQALPVTAYVSGIVENVAGSALTVFVAGVPPDATGIMYGDHLPLQLDYVLEHTPHDTGASEFFMARAIVDEPKERLGASVWNPREEVVATGER